jgi:hypothetical protein
VVVLDGPERSLGLGELALGGGRVLLSCLPLRFRLLRPHADDVGLRRTVADLAPKLTGLAAGDLEAVLEDVVLFP